MKFPEHIFLLIMLIMVVNSCVLDKDNYGEVLSSSDQESTSVLINDHEHQMNEATSIAIMSRGNKMEPITFTPNETLESIEEKVSDRSGKSDRGKPNDANAEPDSAIPAYKRQIRTKSEIFLQSLRKALSRPVNKSSQKNKEDATNNQVKINLLPIRKLTELRKSLLIHPFKIWNLKHRFATMKDIGIHEDKLQDVIKNARNLRLKRKLFKVLRGVDVYLDVIGGSHTAGGGIERDEGGIEGIYYRVITDWWNKTIIPVTGSKLRTRGIGIGGAPSDFFQYCFRSYTHKQLDLVFLESAVNGLTRSIPIIPHEQLTRQLLAYPTEPALVYVNFFRGKTCNTTCNNLQDIGQNELTDNYNITALNWRDAVCSRKSVSLLKPCDLVSKDKRHNNQLAHAHISLMIINLFRRTLLESLSNVMKDINVSVFRAGESKHDLLSRAIVFEIPRQNDQLPPPVFIDPSHLNIDPLCWTSLTPNYKGDWINNSLDIVVTKTVGFVTQQLTKLQSKEVEEKCKNCRLDGYSSWTGDRVGAYSQLSFEVPAHVSKEDNKGRSVVIATRSCWKCGTADVWLDNNYEERKTVDVRDELAHELSWIVAPRVNPGQHTLNIKVVKKGAFPLVGVMLGPPDGPFK
jgi:hypothetical protein